MSKLLEVIKGSCHWAARPEDRLACARRNVLVMQRLMDAKPGLEGWTCFGDPVGAISVEAVADRLYQNRDDSAERRPIDDLGWYARFSGLDDRPSRRLRIESRCGGWSRNGNSAHVTVPTDWRDELSTMLVVLEALITGFEPDTAQVYSGRALNRKADLKLPFPIVDWMVYIADARIPPDELPMVHRIEHIGSGTLVILKKERLHLDRPEDLALVEAVEPVIRRYQKPPLPKETHHPRHDAAKH